MGMHVPLALVVGAEAGEPYAAPPVREIARPPARRNLEADITGFLQFRQEKPFFATLDVALQCVVAEAKPAVFFIMLVAHLHDGGTAEIAQTEDLELEK